MKGDFKAHTNVNKSSKINWVCCLMYPIKGTSCKLRLGIEKIILYFLGTCYLPGALLTASHASSHFYKYSRKIVTRGLKNHTLGFPGGTVIKNPPANAGDTGSIPGLGRSHKPWSN